MTTFRSPATKARPIYSDNPELRRAYLEGAYDELRLLSTSPRFNRPQMEIIEADAAKRRAELEGLGVQFKATR